MRNIVRKESRKVVQGEQKMVAKACKENPKKFWQYVKSRTTTYNSLGNIKHLNSKGENILLTDDTEKSIAFAQHFAKIYTQEPLGNFLEPTQIMAVNTMPALVLTEKNIYEKLSKLKIDKSPGPDMIHPRILKETAVQISTAFKIIFDMSMQSGNLPNDWKCSTVSVIHKKGSKMCISNYRPISLTCIACKVLESLIRDHIMDFFYFKTAIQC